LRLLNWKSRAAAYGRAGVGDEFMGLVPVPGITKLLRVRCGVS